MKRWTAIFYVSLVFVAGIAVGVFGQRLYASRSVSAVTRSAPTQWRTRYVNEMTSRLELSKEQVSKLHGILDRTRAQYKEVRDRYKPDMKRVHDEQVEAIRGILSDMQRQEYERMLVEKSQRKHRE